MSTRPLSGCDLLLPSEVRALHQTGDHGHCHGEPCQAPREPYPCPVCGTPRDDTMAQCACTDDELRAAGDTR